MKASNWSIRGRFSFGCIPLSRLVEYKAAHVDNAWINRSYTANYKQKKKLKTHFPAHFKTTVLNNYNSREKNQMFKNGRYRVDFLDRVSLLPYTQTIYGLKSRRLHYLLAMTCGSYSSGSITSPLLEFNAAWKFHTKATVAEWWTQGLIN